MVLKSKAIDVLNELLGRLGTLLQEPKNDWVFQKWRGDVITALSWIFSEDLYSTEFKKVSYTPSTKYYANSGSRRPPTDDENRTALSAFLSWSYTFLHTRLTEVETFWAEDSSTTLAGRESVEQKVPAHPDRVFVIHGRQLVEEFHTFLRAIGVTPLEWSAARTSCMRETNNPQPNVWQVVDWALSNAGAIVALLTPDDEAYLKESLRSKTEPPWETIPMGQPRPNVIFEAGVVFGRNPNRTVILRVGDHRPISDLQGFHILSLNNSPASRSQVVEALQVAGCVVRVEGNTDWFNAGNFDVK